MRNPLPALAAGERNLEVAGGTRLRCEQCRTARQVPWNQSGREDPAPPGERPAQPEVRRRGELLLALSPNSLLASSSSSDSSDSWGLLNFRCASLAQHGQHSMRASSAAVG
eukprot:CAMPEP_0168483286 /NCGR_PEP_ID=MMETSP0228-20121227/65488_1 /TAXON_ID=133427 /ORGANISM="Protoceratium reticulatum, Strain CCCM 535 (=CCMP 1889)" /LENGTH=110 /DNA_ID=CAMNT_0008499759 /DNA_START=135 /DNA_END=463 /DNA_ORIENTATION=+